MFSRRGTIIATMKQTNQTKIINVYNNLFQTFIHCAAGLPHQGRRADSVVLTV
jgi:hypothetical protein